MVFHPSTTKVPERAREERSQKVTSPNVLPFVIKKLSITGVEDRRHANSHARITSQIELQLAKVDKDDGLINCNHLLFEASIPNPYSINF